MRTEHYERQPTFQRAMKLVVMMYQITGEFPQEEKSGLAAAIRRAATALPAKLADAHGQADPDAATKSFDAALTLLRELQTSVQIAGLLGILTRFRVNRLRGKCQRLASLIERCVEDCETPVEAVAEAA